MKKLNDVELNQKIGAFMDRKTVQHPDLQASDGVRAGKMWHTDMHLKDLWRALGDEPRHKHKTARQY